MPHLRPPGKCTSCNLPLDPNGDCYAGCEQHPAVSIRAVLFELETVIRSATRLSPETDRFVGHEAGAMMDRADKVVRNAFRNARKRTVTGFLRW